MNIFFKIIPLVSVVLIISSACDQRSVDLTNLKYLGFDNKLGCKAISSNYHSVNVGSNFLGTKVKKGS